MNIRYLFLFFIFLANTLQAQILNDTTINKTLLLKLVNDVRTKGCTCGTTPMPPVKPVRWNDTLAKAAWLHSKDMTINNYFSHTNKQNITPSQRLDAIGYKWKWAGENIAYNYPNEAAVIASWIKSEHHCKNIMNPDYKEMGAGRFKSYWTQSFGTKL